MQMELTGQKILIVFRDRTFYASLFINSTKTLILKIWYVDHEKYKNCTYLLSVPDYAELFNTFILNMWIVNCYSNLKLPSFCRVIEQAKTY